MSIAVWWKEKKKKETCFVGFTTTCYYELHYYTDATDAHVKRFFLYYSSTVNYSDYLCTRLINEKQVADRTKQKGKISVVIQREE